MFHKENHDWRFIAWGARNSSRNVAAYLGAYRTFLLVSVQLQNRMMWELLTDLSASFIVTWNPGSPMTPFWPFSPFSPVAPLSPLGPGSPGRPGGAFLPGLPYKTMKSFIKMNWNCFVGDKKIHIPNKLKGNFKWISKGKPSSTYTILQKPSHIPKEFM